MTDPIPIHIAVEDFLSEMVLRVMLEQSGRHFAVGACMGRTGFGYLKKNITGFNKAAKGTPFLILTDLDQAECPPILIQEWLPVPKHDNLLFRIAVREVESWLLAHRKAFAEFLGIRESLVPPRPDELEDPKRVLIELTARSRKGKLREAIIPTPGSTAKIGPDYNGALISFVQNRWKVQEAAKRSPSLNRSFHTINIFQYVYES
jgi:hypothetical protein